MVLSAVTGMVVAEIAKRSVGGYLSEPELRRYSALSEPRGRDFLSGRVALKAAVHRFGAVPDGELSRLEIDNAPNGQPRVAGQAELCCSLAHSSSWGVGVVAARPVGIDIERIRPRRPELLRYIADDEERVAAAIDCLNDSHIISRIWTMKEAVLKGMGVGLAVSPRQLRLSKLGRDVFLIDVLTSNATPCSRWKVSTYAVNDFWIAVATGEDTDDHNPINWYLPPDVPVAGAAKVGA